MPAPPLPPGCCPTDVRRRLLYTPVFLPLPARIWSMALPLLEDDAGMEMLGEEGAAPPPRPAPAAPLVEDDAMVTRSWGRFSHEM